MRRKEASFMPSLPREKWGKPPTSGRVHALQNELIMTENLFSTIKNLVNPDFLNKASTLLGESSGQTQAGIFAAIPTFLSGVMAKGSTPNGANDLLRTIKNEGFDTTTPISPSPSAMSLDKGESLLASVFGESANGVIDKFSTGTGLTTPLSKKILALVAPLVMSVIGSKAKEQGMNPSALSGFLSEQKTSLLGVADAVKTAYTSVTPTELAPKKKGVGRYVAYVAIVLAALWFFFGRHRPSEQMTMDQSPLKAWKTGITETPMSDPQMLSDFKSTVRSDSRAALPKRFSFNSITFATGSSELSLAAKDTLRKVALALRENPGAKIRVEGNADNTGNVARNQKLADARAAAVRQQLLWNGAAAPQIITMGKGESAPVDTNDNAQGRRNNRRIDIVVLSH